MRGEKSTIEPRKAMETKIHLLFSNTKASFLDEIDGFLKYCEWADLSYLATMYLEIRQLIFHSPLCCELGQIKLIQWTLFATELFCAINSPSVRYRGIFPLPITPGWPEVLVPPSGTQCSGEWQLPSTLSHLSFQLFLPFFQGNPISIAPKSLKHNPVLSPPPHNRSDEINITGQDSFLKILFWNNFRFTEICNNGMKSSHIAFPQFPLLSMSTKLRN